MLLDRVTGLQQKQDLRSCPPLICYQFLTGIVLAEMSLYYTLAPDCDCGYRKCYTSTLYTGMQINYHANHYA